MQSKFLKKKKKIYEILVYFPLEFKLLTSSHPIIPPTACIWLFINVELVTTISTEIKTNRYKIHPQTFVIFEQIDTVSPPTKCIILFSNSHLQYFFFIPSKSPNKLRKSIKNKKKNVKSSTYWLMLTLARIQKNASKKSNRINKFNPKQTK